MKAQLSILIFAVSYCFIATDKINKTIVAILGAVCVLLLKLLTFEEAVRAVDLNVVFLLVGMMTAVYVLSKTGFFEWVAISVAKRAKGDPWRITFLLLSVTALLSAFLDNVTTVVLLVPMTILLMQLLELSPVPVIIMEAIMSNVGGTATLIGDPPNILIGSRGGLSFNEFLMNLTPIVFLVFIVAIFTVYLWFGRKFHVPDNVKARVNEAIPHLAIIDKKNMIRSLWVFALIFAGFFIHSYIGVEPGVIALGGGMLMLLFCNSETEDTLMRVEWAVIFFFIGMFMMIAALEVNGVMAWLGQKIINLSGGNLFLLCIIILWGSALFSAILGSIPFTITMVPLVKHFVEYFSLNSGIVDPIVIRHTIAYPLWWALALGACLGGNGTLIGAAANLVAAQMSRKNKYPITFMHFLKYGLPFTIQSMIICTIYLWLRYFR